MLFEPGKLRQVEVAEPLKARLISSTLKGVVPAHIPNLDAVANTQ